MFLKSWFFAMRNTEETGCSHTNNQAGRGDQENQKDVAVPRAFQQELRSLREYVDQRLDTTNRRIDVLHSHVTGMPGPAIYTDVTLENWSNEHLTLYDEVDWYGFANRPLVIPAQLSEKIKHQSDSQTGDSKGGVAYTIMNNIRWVVAWSNMKYRGNKVYIDIIETDARIDWNFYQSLLDTSNSDPHPVNKYWNTTMANIDPNSVTPLMKASLKPAIKRMDIPQPSNKEGGVLHALVILR